MGDESLKAGGFGREGLVREGVTRRSRSGVDRKKAERGQCGGTGTNGDGVRDGVRPLIMNNEDRHVIAIHYYRPDPVFQANG